MTQEIEYHDEMIAMLEIISGPGFMAPISARVSIKA